MIGSRILHYQIIEQLGQGGNPAIAGQALPRFHSKEAENHGR
jgi:hypothetical protein